MNEITKAEIRSKLGNISLLRELLLGDQLEAYDYQLEEYRLKIDSLATNLQESQAATEERMRQLEQKLLDKIDSVGQKLEKNSKYYHHQSQQEQNSLQQKLAALSQYSHENIDLLHQDFSQKTGSLKLEIVQAKIDLDRDLSRFKHEIANRLEQSLGELDTSKISRSDLASILFELCLNLKGDEADTDTTTDNNLSEGQNLAALPETPANSETTLPEAE